MRTSTYAGLVAVALLGATACGSGLPTIGQADGGDGGCRHSAGHDGAAPGHDATRSPDGSSHSGSGSSRNDAGSGSGSTSSSVAGSDAGSGSGSGSDGGPSSSSASASGIGSASASAWGARAAGRAPARRAASMMPATARATPALMRARAPGCTTQGELVCQNNRELGTCTKGSNGCFSLTDVTTCSVANGTGACSAGACVVKDIWCDATFQTCGGTGSPRASPTSPRAGRRARRAPTAPPEHGTDNSSNGTSCAFTCAAPYVVDTVNGVCSAPAPQLHRPVDRKHRQHEDPHAHVGGADRVHVRPRRGVRQLGPGVLRVPSGRKMSRATASRWAAAQTSTATSRSARTLTESTPTRT